MVSTRNTLERIGENLEESMGVRAHDRRPRLSPVPQAQDAGRIPLSNVGKVDVNLVIPDPDQPRVDLSEGAFDRLAQSIRDKGQLSAIRVRWSASRSRWVIIAGERRWRAAKRAGLTTIDCYFHEGEISQSEVLEQQLIENCLREDLHPIEEARAFAKLIKLNGWTGKQVAEALRVQPSTVARTLALLKLPADVQQQVVSGKISARSAYEISKLKDDDSRRALARKTVKESLTHEQAAGIVRQRRGKRKAQQHSTKQTFVLENGWKVVVSAKRQGSYHDIEAALVEVLEEVRLRISNNVQIF